MQPTVAYKIPSRLLNPASGYLTGYSHTLNPFAGCSFACSYCYVREMPIAKFRREAWGTWVDVKHEAAKLLTAELVKAKRKGPVTIFMSSSTDPYQPIEHKEQITRSLLKAMVQERPDFLFLQTRSPLVIRDIDLLLHLQGHVRVSMTVETDLEPIRRAFTPPSWFLALSNAMPASKPRHRRRWFSGLREYDVKFYIDKRIALENIAILLH